ncbi:unnamed protein product [Protopolystoma xenopodis]|uniref:Hsp90 chaperone protein kinase-targeting subunit n=1 Tax=Protopolystoma xenopodis TaxID=117903 RepID=A0A448WJJ5_9PLAT|nr:unnamed protein product [Protopolystoma xenopodis]
MRAFLFSPLLFAMAGLNYSKWDHIEVSDDEDDTHPNIDTPSLFRWRHQARVERDAQWNKEKIEFETGLKEHLGKYEKAERALNEALKSGSRDLAKYKKDMEKMEEENELWKVKQEEWKKKEKLRPWNIDTICHEGKSKTFINSAKLKFEKPEKEDDETAIQRLKDFVDKHRKLIRQFGLFSKPADSQKFLSEHPYLVCDETANQLVLLCIDLAVEEKFDLMNHVSHQCIIMQFMLELAKSLKVDPRAVIRLFFAKFLDPEPEYKKAFEDELEAFRQRIRARANVRIEEAMAKLEEEEKMQRLGPGGLDPVEVFESLPKELQTCFETKDVSLLTQTIMKMDPKDAEYHMKRCIDSGLWVENASKMGDDNEAGQKDSEEKSLAEEVDEEDQRINDVGEFSKS